MAPDPLTGLSYSGTSEERKAESYQEKFSYSSYCKTFSVNIHKKDRES